MKIYNRGHIIYTEIESGYIRLQKTKNLFRKIERKRYENEAT